MLHFFLCGLFFLWVSFAIFNVAQKMGFFNQLFIFNKCLRCVIWTMISFGGLIISLKSNFCWVIWSNACGDQRDRSKCLAVFLEEFGTSLWSILLPLDFSFLGVARAFLLATEEMGTIRGQTFPRKGCAVSVIRILAVYSVTSQMHECLVPVP